YDQHAKIALVGECCAERLHEVHTAGVFSHRNYDFLAPSENKDTNDAGYSVEQVAHALGTVQRAIAGTDKELKHVWQRGGMSLPRTGRSTPSIILGRRTIATGLSSIPSVHIARARHSPARSRPRRWVTRRRDISR